MLLDQVFGADRHSRTAYRIRDGMAPIAALSFAVFARDALVGTIQCWPVALHREDGRVPLTMVGPVAIRPGFQGQGYGRALMRAATEGATALGRDGALMLIGDPEYYARFGFSDEATSDWDAPGPFARHRLLARGTAVPKGPGLLGPDQPAFEPRDATPPPQGS